MSSSLTAVTLAVADAKEVSYRFSVPVSIPSVGVLFETNGRLVQYLVDQALAESQDNLALLVR
jgi:hypothetical protein